MLIVERQQRLLEILRDEQTGTLEALAEVLDVSGSTVRRDLEALERQGLVERTHGGAIYRGPHHHSFVFAERMHEHAAAKQAIGAYAAGLIEPQMTVCLDGGSTVYYAARQIEARPIQVVTNSLSIANLFADDEKVELLFVGGNLYPRTGVMLGPIATSALATLHADLMLFSLAGIHDDEAFNQNMAMAEVEQTMIRQAARSVLLMDSSKFGRKSLARVCHVSDVELVVTDCGISERWVRTMGDQLFVVDAASEPDEA